MIDKDKIFQLFVDGKEIKDQKTKDEIKEFMNGPFAKIGMFVKLIQNHKVFHQKLEKFLKQENPNYNIESTREASEFTVYNRAYSYLSKIDPTSDKHVRVIKSFDPKLIKKSLNILLNYFISTEEYERCAHIHKIQENFKK